MNARSLFRTFFQPLTIAVGIALLARLTMLQAYSIPSGSMSPSLEPGDHVLATPLRVLFYQAEPERGDVVVFRHGDAGSGFFVKRVIALPGELVEIRDGAVWIDGEPLDEPYLKAPYTGGEIAELIPENRYFVLGDHRDDSIDSRSWGPVHAQNILGRARLIFWSSTFDEPTLGVSAAAHSGSRSVRFTAPRWNRVLRVVR